MVREGGDSGKPVVVEFPESEAADAINKSASEVARQISIKNAAACACKAGQ